MGHEHHYQATVTWTGNLGEGTAGYRSYSRDHEVSGNGKPVLPGSSDPAFRGDPRRWNPEELLVAALSQCHMLWFLHLCAANGIVVISYTDDARGTMAEGADGGGEFTAVALRPRAAIADSGQANRALELHEEAHRLCFIARSVNFPVSCEPVITRLQLSAVALSRDPGPLRNTILHKTGLSHRLHDPRYDPATGARASRSLNRMTNSGAA